MADPSNSTESHREYIGNELELFQHAVNWKSYYSKRLKPFINGDVLEVGAGFGANIPYLYRDDLASWLSIEPDRELCQMYAERQNNGEVPARCEIKASILQDLPADQLFDSIIYIDVLEHIENDKGEVETALSRLKPGGHLIILCPAHQFLFSPFDQAIGHYRRYNKSMYRQLTPQKPVRLEYLDSVGMLASMANKLLLKQSSPNIQQIKFWDRFIVRTSYFVDPLIFRMIGKTIVGVWKK